jgi:hypothetical protein
VRVGGVGGVGVGGASTASPSAAASLDVAAPPSLRERAAHATGAASLFAAKLGATIRRGATKHAKALSATEPGRFARGLVDAVSERVNAR